LQQVCKKKVATAVAIASIVQEEAIKWVTKMKKLTKQEVKGAETASQTVSQIEAWFAQVNEAVQRAKDQLQPLGTYFISLAMTRSPAQVEDLVDYLEGAMAGVRKIVTQICNLQVEARPEDVLATDHVLQSAAELLKEAYRQQTKTAAEIQTETQARAKKWVTQTKIIDKMEVQKQKTLDLMKESAEDYHVADTVVIASRARMIVQYTMEMISETKAILDQIVAMKTAAGADGQAAPAFSAPSGKEADVEIAAEKDTLNESIKKLDQACREKLTTAVQIASSVQGEAGKWMDKVEEWTKQGVKGTETTSQTGSQIRKSFAQVNENVQRVKDQLQPLETYFISLAMTESPAQVEYLVDYLEGAMAGVRKIVAQVVQIDHLQVEAKPEDILAANHILQSAAEPLKEAYLQQTIIAAEIQREIHASVTDYITYLLELWKRTKIIDRLQQKVQKWKYEELIDKMEARKKETQDLVDIWTGSDQLRKNYYAADTTDIARGARKIVQYTMEMITETKAILD
jgi:gas vesicle protein